MFDHHNVKEIIVADQSGTAKSAVQALRKLTLGNDFHRRQVAQGLNISVIELGVMGHLHESGRLTPRQVGERLGITTGSTTAVLDRIEQAGYIVRTPNPDDRRSLHLSLTPEGKKAMVWSLKQDETRLRKILKGYTEEQLATASELLTAMGEVLGDPTGRE